MSDEALDDKNGHAGPGKGRPRGRKLAFAIISLILGFGAFVPMVVNLAVAKGLTWSLYAIGGTAMTWFVLAPLFLARRHRLALSWLAAVVTVPAYLGLVQAMTPAVAWLVPLGLPSAAIGLAGLGALVWLWAYSGLHALPALSLGFLVMGLVSFGESAVTAAWLGSDPALWIRDLVSLSLLGAGFIFGFFALILGKFRARVSRERRGGA
ncbi:MAG: hypothetical protein JNG85_09595 [Spirochaetaceae bacterium]|nr:hypothetical protein [Spirochaetaceae bacterium]